MIERAAAFAFGQPQETERPMGVVVPRLDRAGATEILDGLARSAQRLLRDGAVVVRRRIVRLGRDRLVEISDGRLGLALGGGEDAEVVRNGGVAGSNAQRRAVASFRVVQ